MILTGRQIRQARTLLGLNRSRLSSKVGCITTLVIMRAEENEDEPLPIDQAVAIRTTLERAGVDFSPEGVRLRKVEP